MKNIFRRYNIIRVAWATVILAIVFSVFYFGYYRRIDKVEFYRRHHAAIQFVNKLSNVLYLPKMFFSSKLERYDLIIKEENLEFLNKNLPETYNDKILTEEYQKEADAKFYYQGREYKAKVRYRGDMDAHWRDPQKSWLINFNNKNYFQGANKINLIIPVDRYYLLEELSNYRAKKLGLAVPDSKFVNLFVNGKREGVYWQIESFSKDILEKQNIPGDINLYGSLDFWDASGSQYFDFASIYSWKKYSQDSLSGSIDNYSDLKILLDTVNNPSDEYFYDNIWNIFDKDNFYSWVVQQYLAASTHQSGANLRLYFNTTAGKFYFIPWDVSTGSNPPALTEINYNAMLTRILKNPVFLHERNTALWKYVGDDKNLEDDLKHYDELDALTKNDFFKDTKKVASTYAYRKDIQKIRNEISEKFLYLRKNLEDANAFVTVAVDNKKAIATLNIGTTGFSALDLSKIEIIGKECGSGISLLKDSNYNGIYDNGDKPFALFICNNAVYTARPELIIYSAKSDFDLGFLRPKFNSSAVFIVSDRASDKEFFQDKTLIVNFINAVTGKSVDHIDIKYALDNLQFNPIARKLSIREFVKNNPEFSMEGNNLGLRGGSYVIQRDIIIPEGTVLHIDAGTTLYMAANASILSYSAVIAQGTPQAPITIKGISDTPWGTFSVIEAREKSIFSNVSIVGGGQEALNGIFTSGQLSIFRSPALIENSEFLNAHGDDSVNIKYGMAEIRNSRFIKNSFDGLDFDVTDSIADGNVFLENGNDGMDISSGKPIIKNNRIEKSGDKCISIGENSKAIIFNNLLVGCNIGIASKDLSSPIIINTTMVNNNTGFSAHQKKQIFGGGQGEIINSIIWNNSTGIELDLKSTIIISHSDIQGGYGGEGNINQDPQLNKEFIPLKDSDINIILRKDIYSQYSFPEKSVIGYYP